MTTTTPVTQIVSTTSSNFNQNYISVEPISSIDLFNVVNDIASTNLGYLTIAVAVLTLMGGAYIYFNIRPFRDSLNKHESRLYETEKAMGEKIDAIHDEYVSVSDSLALSVEEKIEELNLTLGNTLAKAEENFENKLSSAQKVAEEKMVSELKNYRTEAKNYSLEQKDNLTNLVSSLDKSLSAEIQSLRKEISQIKDTIRNLEVDIKELEVEEYSRKGKQGAIITRVELLKIDLDKGMDYWRIPDRLIAIRDYVKEKRISTHVNTLLMKELNRFKQGDSNHSIVEEIKKNIEVDTA